MDSSSLKHPILIASWVGFVILAVMASLENIQLFALDRQSLNYLGHFITVQRTEIFKTVATISAPAVIILLSLGLSLVLWHSKQFFESLAALTMTVTGNLVGFLIKLLVQRPRPTTMLVNASGYSFPSGHVVSATIFVFVMFLFGVKLIRSVRVQLFTAMVLIFWLGLVAISRIYLQVHYPSDVIGGGLFSLVWCDTILIAFRRSQTNLERLIINKRGIDHES
jgi:undecaprenyl-diphosphatase